MSNTKNNTPNIETLKKIQYNSLDQYTQDINRNFAIIQNSPFYKGLPGKPGNPGNPGNLGLRGSTIVFVNLSKFNEQFPGEIVSASNINLDWLNLRLKNADQKIKILKCFEINQFIHGDIIVLTNTLMLTYNALSEQLIDTGIAFNEQSQIINNLDKKIEATVKYYVDNNVSIKNLKTIFAGYDTYAKNFGENNSVFISQTVTNSSVFAPYIEGVTSTQGALVSTHRYWGLVDDEFGKNETGTIVFGSMKKYCELLMKTTLTDGNETLTSDYAPGVNNIPSAVFLQDTPNNGLMFGWKDNIGKNLRRFGQIYKNELNELIIQSDSGNDENTNGSDFSSIHLHKDYLKYSKQVIFEDNLELGRDFISKGNIKNRFIRTGLEFAGSDDLMIVGLETETSKYKNISKSINLDNFKNKVIVTDASGFVLSNYVIEKGELNQNNIIDNNKITTHIGNSIGVIPEIYNTSVLTTNYFSFIAKKINNLITYIGNNFYKKSEFTNGTITEHIKLGGDLDVTNNLNAKNINFSGSFNMFDTDSQKRIFVLDANTGNVTIGKSVENNVGIFSIRTKDTIFHSSIIKFSKFKNNVFVTDGEGNITTSYSILTDAYETDFTTKPVVSADTTKLLSSLYLSWLVDMIYYKFGAVNDTYYSKTQFGNNTIPTLKLNSLLNVGSTTNPFFSVKSSDNSLNVGNTTTKASITFNLSSFSLLGIVKSFTEESKTNILSIDNNGKVTSGLMNSGKIISVNSTDNDKLSGGPSKSYEIVTGDNIQILLTSINSIITQIGQITGSGGDGGSLTDYVLKTSLSNGTISNFVVSNNATLKKNINLGGESADIIQIKNDTTFGWGIFMKYKKLYFGTPITTISKPGIRFLSTDNSLVANDYQPASNHYSLSSSNGLISINDINLTNKDNPLVGGTQLLSTFDMILELVTSINFLKNLVGSGESDGNFYTKTEMINGLSISAKFSGTSFNLGSQIYSDGTSVFVGYLSNKGYTYINSDLRLKQHTNYPILSTDSNGEIVKTYTVSTRTNTQVGINWDTYLTLHNGASTTLLLTTNDANYLIKAINVMKTKMVELNNKASLSTSDVKTLIWDQMPIGMIIGWKPGTTFPDGWAVCDGNNGTPNLNGKLIYGSDTSTGTSIGSNSVKLSKANMPLHSHSLSIQGNGTHSHKTGSYGYADGKHTHNVSWAGDQTLDNAQTVGVAKSYQDFKGNYDFGCNSTDSSHTHNIETNGYHDHACSMESEGSGAAFSINPAGVSLCFIMKIKNV